ncbi:MAG: hypothetical protein U9Q92_06540 [archaeon]|nr:hypothetical protein [archaeon]
MKISMIWSLGDEKVEDLPLISYDAAKGFKARYQINGRGPDGEPALTIQYNDSNDSTSNSCVFDVYPREGSSIDNITSKAPHASFHKIVPDEKVELCAKAYDCPYEYYKYHIYFKPNPRPAEPTMSMKVH